MVDDASFSKPKRSFHVLGLDPGFANVGYALVAVSADGVQVVRGSAGEWRMGTWKTKKSDKKRSVRASEDDVRRAREIVKSLRELLLEADVKVLCVETMSFPRSSRVAQQMGVCWGVITALAEVLDIPITQATPQEIKKKVCGSGSASKQAVQKVLAEKYGLDPGDWLKSEIEHPFDALAAVGACMDSEVIKTAQKMMR